MKTLLSTILKLFRNALLIILNREFLIFLFFLFLSGAFWLGIALNETAEREIHIPVKLVNIPKNAIITTELPDTISVVVKDKGFAHAAYMYGDQIHALRVNFALFAQKEKGHGIVSSTEIQKMVMQTLFSTSKITDIKPDNMEFFFNYGQSRSLPITISGTVRTGHTYYLANVKFWPSMVTVYANKDILDKITTVYTEKLDIKNLTDTSFVNVKIAPIRGAKIMPSVVRMGLYPDILTEASVEVPVEAANMPEGKVLRTFPAKVKVIYTVGTSHYKKVNVNDFKVVVDYNEIAKNPSDKCRLILKTIPSIVTFARLERNQVDYLIEQQ
ncbi:MAG: YbbR-like domain-containing protein [Prevotella sp.]|nr:YbbR-like domain-containing protein [Prevotella sp.]